MEINWLYCTIPTAFGLGFLLVILYSCCALSGYISQRQDELLRQIEAKSGTTITSEPRKKIKEREYLVHPSTQVKKWNERYPDWRGNGGHIN